LGWRAKRVADFSQKIGKNSYTTSGNWRLDRRATIQKILAIVFTIGFFYHADLG